MYGFKYINKLSLNGRMSVFLKMIKSLLLLLTSYYKTERFINMGFLRNACQKKQETTKLNLSNIWAH